MSRATELITRLSENGSLSVSEYLELIQARSPESAAELRARADEKRREVYGDAVYIRGLIEISNICKNDCYYCGIRRSNTACQRYRLTPEEILECCREGHALGFRTFVLQGGEDGYYTDGRLCNLISDIKKLYPDSAVTLSLGERSRESYARLKAAGADRYLLREETADAEHYSLLHPEAMSHKTRLSCLADLSELGYQVGAGFMVGSPYQTPEHLARELKFIEELSPAMCGIGPFIPQRDTPLGNCTAGSIELTCYLLSILRLIKPTLLLPATTALASLHPDGRKLGLLSGANVVMPNLSPASVRKKYALYDGKRSDGSEAAECLASLKEEIESVGLCVVTDRGDAKSFENANNT